MSKPLSYPNMYPEVLEAIHLAHEDCPDVEVDCLLYLADLKNSPSRVIDLSEQARYILSKMGRCPDCGEVMCLHHYYEYHTELDGNPPEAMTDKYCPNCDLPFEFRYK